MTKKKVKYFSFNIPVIFKKYRGQNLIEIFSEKDANEIIKANKFYTADISLLRIVPEFVYNYFLKNNNNKINNECFSDNSENNLDDNIFNYMNYVEQEQKESIEDGSVDNLNKDFENIIKNENNSLSKVDDIEKKRWK